MKARGSINTWTCNRCRTRLVAIHVDRGVTPMFLACRVTGCGGMGTSAGYPAGLVPDDILELLAWEWAHPSTTQLKRWRRTDPAMYEHCRRGGLVLRPLTDAGRQIADGYAPDPNPCGAIQPGVFPYMCTQPAGHTGEHRASTHEHRTVSRWPNLKGTT